MSRQEIEIRTWTQRVSANPSDPKTHLGLGYAYQSDGRYDKALEQYAIVLKSNPSDTAALYNTGNIYFKLGVNDRAEKSMWAVLDIDPTHELAAKALGDYYAGKKQYKSLIATVKPAAEAHPELADLQYLLGMAHEKLGDTADRLGVLPARAQVRAGPDRGPGGAQAGRGGQVSGEEAAPPTRSRSARGESRMPNAMRFYLVVLVVLLIVLVVLLVMLLRLEQPADITQRGGETQAGIEPVFAMYGPGRGKKPLFDKPMAAAWGPGGRIYVADSKNNRIVVFDRSGRYLRQFGGFGIAKPPAGTKVTWKPGQLNYPTGVATDTNGDVYVADFNNDSISVFDDEGTFLRRFPDPYRPTGRGSSGAGNTGIAVTAVAVSRRQGVRHRRLPGPRVRHPGQAAPAVRKARRGAGRPRPSQRHRGRRAGAHLRHRLEPEPCHGVLSRRCGAVEHRQPDHVAHDG